jgi:hypothetical protein
VPLLMQVARKTFVAALQERGSVLFVPGGQAELVHTHRASAKCREWVAYTGHKGQLSTQQPIVTLLLHAASHRVERPGRCSW